MRADKPRALMGRQCPNTDNLGFPLYCCITTGVLAAITLRIEFRLHTGRASGLSVTLFPADVIRPSSAQISNIYQPLDYFCSERSGEYAELSGPVFQRLVS